MKSSLKIVIALLILFSTASAQTFTQPGNTELGGDISYTSVKLEDDASSESVFSFSPYIGFMVSPGFEFGLRPVLTEENDITEFNFFIAPAFNINTNSNVYPYVEFLVGYNSASSGASSINGLGFGADGGLKVVIGASSLLLVKLEYVHDSYGYSGNSLINNTGASLSTVTFGVGFRVFLHRASKGIGPIEKQK